MTENLMFPGGVGLTHLRVYDTQAPDGLHGGSPHVHFACSECYYAQSGRGRVQTLCAQGFREFELQTGALVWFSPGVIHRLINDDGQLEIFVVMGNGGLPEAGDFVLTMPPSLLRDRSAYFEAASLSPRGEVFASDIEAAYRRRDLSVQGFETLCQGFEERGMDALREFYEMALPLVQPKLGTWREVWHEGPLHAAQDTGRQLEALQNGDVSHLLQGVPRTLEAPGTQRKLGMCGTLGTYLPEGVTVAAQYEGKQAR